MSLEGMNYDKFTSFFLQFLHIIIPTLFSVFLFTYFIPQYLSLFKFLVIFAFSTIRQSIVIRAGTVRECYILFKTDGHFGDAMVLLPSVEITNYSQSVHCDRFTMLVVCILCYGGLHQAGPTCSEHVQNNIRNYPSPETDTVRRFYCYDTYFRRSMQVIPPF